MNEAHNIDNIAGMKKYPDGFFDLAIVDPPYGIGQNWTKDRKICQKKKALAIKNGAVEVPDKEIIDMFNTGKFTW